MKKIRKYYLNPDKTILFCEVIIDGKKRLIFQRNLESFSVFSDCRTSDVTTFDLELHSFLRVSHQMIVNPDVLAGEKIEEMFEIDNPNI